MNAQLHPVLFGGSRPFNPANLFASNEPGVWYDQSDFSTLFQESSGVTPVTAVEQAVGLSLDKSRGLVLGPELLPGAGTVNSPWAYSAANVITRNGATSGTANASFLAVVGRTYLIRFTVADLSGDTFFFRCGGTASGNITANGAYEYRVTAASAATIFQAAPWAGGAGDVTITLQTIRELSGTHRIQPSAASRPILRARYNQLTHSEQFDNAAWTKRGTFTITANDAIAPDGTLTADKVTGLDTGSNDMFNADYQTVVIAPAGACYAPSIWVKRISTSGVFFVGNPINTAQGQWNVDLSQLPDAWTRITATTTGVTVVNPFVTSASGTGGIQLRGVSGGPLSMHIWGADLRRSSDTYLPYQRIAAATDYDTVGFPVYLAFDGSDDSMYTGGNLDLSGTDKVTVFAGHTKLSDATLGMFAELSATDSGNNGMFSVITEENPGYSWRSKGTLRADAAVSSGYAAPTTRVLTGVADISGDVCTLRLDGVSAASNTGDQGTGNFGSYPLYMGRRNNASLPFNGREYGLIVRGAATSATQIQQAERWMAAKQGRSL